MVARPTPHPSAEVALPHANGPFTVLCTTRDARAETRFTLSVFANEPVRLERMPPPTEAFGARLRGLEAREQAATRAAEVEIEAIEQRCAQRKRAVGAAAAI
jgi:hypothetical protein